MHGSINQGEKSNCGKRPVVSLTERFSWMLVLSFHLCVILNVWCGNATCSNTNLRGTVGGTILGPYNVKLFHFIPNILTSLRSRQHKHRLVVHSVAWRALSNAPLFYRRTLWFAFKANTLSALIDFLFLSNWLTRNEEHVEVERVSVGQS